MMSESIQSEYLGELYGPAQKDKVKKENCFGEDALQAWEEERLSFASHQLRWMSCLKDQKTKVRALEDIYRCQQEKKSQQGEKRQLLVSHVRGDQDSISYTTEAMGEEDFKEGEVVRDPLCQILQKKIEDAENTIFGKKVNDKP